MASRKPTLYNLKDIPKTTKTEHLTCRTCGRIFERKPGRIFICLFCGSTEKAVEQQ